MGCLKLKKLINMLLNNYKHGIVFPIELKDGAPIYASIEDSVGASIRTLLAWPKHRRAFDDSFGTTTDLLWLPQTAANYKHLAGDIRKSILDNDKRVLDVIINIFAVEQQIYIEALAHINNDSNIYTKIEL